MLGLETALALTADRASACRSERVLALLVSWRPAAHRRAAPTTAGPSPPAPANLCVIDPRPPGSSTAGRWRAESRNTPYDGRKLTGRVRHTVLEGEPVVVDGEAQR